jgi:hypothetical protein
MQPFHFQVPQNAFLIFARKPPSLPESEIPPAMTSRLEFLALLHSATRVTIKSYSQAQSSILSYQLCASFRINKGDFCAEEPKATPNQI